MNRDLTDVGALVTGASSGIGEGIARALSSRGAQVVCVARKPESLNALVTSIRAEGNEAVAAVGDAADREFMLATIQGY